MSETTKPIAIVAADAPSRAKKSVYPEPFASLMQARDKKVLGDLFGLTNFGVNLTRIAPGGRSALRHAHAKQDELIYVLEGHPTLVTDAGDTQLHPGMCAGFKAGSGDAHHLVNRSNEDVLYLEIGDRSAGDGVYFRETRPKMSAPCPSPSLRSFVPSRLPSSRTITA